jgi:hypothetical protein
MNFERGIDPKHAMGIGWRAMFESMGDWLLFTEKDLYPSKNWNDISDNTRHYHDISDVSTIHIHKNIIPLHGASVIIIIIEDKFKILKNRFSHHDKIYKIEKLPEIVFEIKKEYDRWKNVY